MPLTLIFRAAAVAVCLAFALPTWGDEHEAAPPTSAETADEAQAPDEAAAPAAADQAWPGRSTGAGRRWPLAWRR